MKTRINDLPITEKLPEIDEFIVPIFTDFTENVTRRISIKTLVDLIVQHVKNDTNVKLIYGENFIKFIKE